MWVIPTMPDPWSDMPPLEADPIDDIPPMDIDRPWDWSRSSLNPSITFSFMENYIPISWVLLPSSNNIDDDLSVNIHNAGSME